MKPPKRVTVGPHRYRVVVDDNAIVASSGASGRCDAEGLVISLNGGMAPTALADTLLHELVHACVGPCNLDEKVEERVALALGPALLALIRDNPRLVRWIEQVAA